MSDQPVTPDREALNGPPTVPCPADCDVNYAHVHVAEDDGSVYVEDVEL